MPCFKSHSIHGEIVFDDIDKKIDINKEDIKTFCIGPDALLLRDPNAFHYVHQNNTKDYFETMLKYIKDNKLEDNNKVISFLYGGLDHFVLDSTSHPFIYYMTEGVDFETKISPHNLIEHWIDDYICNKYDKNEDNYYHGQIINDKELKDMINRIYIDLYNTNNATSKYNYGLIVIKYYDLLLRRKFGFLTRAVDELFNIGDTSYYFYLHRVYPYLNKEHDVWLNPETKEEYNTSFDDIWLKSIEISKDTIEEVNRYLYGDGILNSYLIQNNISYNTGLPCEKGQTKKYIKTYRK